MYIPYRDMKKSAQVLETRELQEAIRRTRDKILDSPEPFESTVLAKYGLILCHELCARSNCDPPIKQTFWMSRLTGSPEWPEFMDNYYANHRALLVAIGWMRYLGGLNRTIEEFFASIKSPEALEEGFRKLLKPGDDGSNRSYSHFTEKPAAYLLWPKE